MQWLASISIRRPVLASVLMLGLVVIGLVGYRKLGVDKFPKVDFPVITIVTPYAGASPSAIETDVSQKIEEAINTVGGLESLTSTSTDGVSLVVAQFALEVDIDKAATDVSERVATVLRDLPPGLRPEIKKADPDAAPVVVLSVKGPATASMRDRTRIADKIVKQRIERLTGVGQVVILGGQKRQINVLIDPIRLAAAGVTALDVRRSITKANANAPAGRLGTGPTSNTLRTEGRALDLAAIGAIVVGQRGDHPIRLDNVATIEDTEADEATAASLNGDSAIALSVRKQSGQNTLAVVDRVRAEVAQLKRDLPAGYTAEVVRDNSLQIRTAASQVLEHLVVGAGLAALIVLLFLGSLRSTLISAISIPISIVSTFGLMMFAGFTLNLMTLLALALAVGIVIDDAIVVLENIHRFVDEKRMEPFQAAIYATKEVGPAVLATTLSLMAVFLPVAFMSGVVGRFLFSFGVTMVFAILVSMIVAFTLTPMMAARMLRAPPPRGERRRSWFERASDAAYRPVSRLYTSVLAFCLRHRWIVGLAIVGSCVSTGPLAKRVGGDLLPANDDAQFEVLLRRPEGTSLEATTLLADRIARKIRAYPQIDSTLITVADGDQAQFNVARIYVKMTDPLHRVSSQKQVMETIRREVLPDVPKGERVSVQPINDFSVGGQSAAVSYVISGPDLDQLELYGKRVIAELRKVPGVADPDSSLLDPVGETVVKPDLVRAALVGVDPQDVTATLATLVGGVTASTFEDGGEQYDVFLRAADGYRDDPAALSLMTVPSRTRGQVRLSDVVTVGPGMATSAVTRFGRERAVLLRMNVSAGFSEAAVVAAAEAALRNLDLPAGYKFEAFGRSKEMAKMKAAFRFAILLSIAFMYLVLAAQFESWLYPFIIMLSLPLVVPFAMMSLAITGGSLNIFSMLGVIVLFAMVKKNAILQVAHTNDLRRQGLPRSDAVLAANRDRLKPILMTTFAFVAGMLPLVTSKGIGAGFSKAMASVVVGGQMLSLLLTLVAIPVIYTWVDDLARAGSRLAAKLRGHPSTRRATDIGIVRWDPEPTPLPGGNLGPALPAAADRRFEAPRSAGTAFFDDYPDDEPTLIFGQFDGALGVVSAQRPSRERISRPSLHPPAQATARSPLLPIFLVVLVDALGFTIVLPLLPFYAQHFGASDLIATSLVSVYALCSLISSPVIGRLSDKYGRKRLLLLSQAGTCAGFLVLGFAGGLWMLFLGRILDGLTAGNLSTAQAYISDHTAPENRAKAFGVIGMAFGIGFFIGPALAGWLSGYGLQIPFIVAASLSIVSMICTATLLREGTGVAAPPRHDAAASGGMRPSRSGLATYLAYFRRPQLRSLFIQFFLFTFSLAAFTSGAGLFAQQRFTTADGHPWTQREVGFLYAFSGLLGIIIQGVLLGPLVKKLGELRLAVIGFVAIVAAYMTLGFTATLALLVVVIAVVAFGNSVLRPVITSQLTQVTDRHEHGVVLGIAGALSGLAMMIAPPIGGALLDREMTLEWALMPAAAALLALGAALVTRPPSSRASRPGLPPS